MNSPERGDTRPCVQPGCVGVMHFGREPQVVRDGVVQPPGPLGWICRTEPQHSTSRWEDDGGRR